MISLKTSRLITVLLASLLISACATRSDSNPIIPFELDRAALFGSVVDEFLLPDGSEASIRKFENAYSLKLQNSSRVIDIEQATQLKFRSAQTVGGFTLIVLEKAERNCASKTHLLAIRGTEVRAWDFGNCKAWPQSEISSKEAIFDVAEGAGITRYEFIDGRLLFSPAPRRQMPMPARQAPRAVPPPVAPPPTPSPPAAPARSSASGDIARPKASASTPAATRKPVQSTYVPAPDPVFQPKEQTPRVIYMDKQ